jgi:AdoMet-dependent rRNA methyltransferase SPB1
VAAERAAAAAIDARPIKKVAQAKARKAKRLTARLEAARKKAEAIVEGGGGGDDLGARGKAREVAKLYARARAGAGALRSGKAGKKMSRSAAYTANKKAKPLDPRLRADQRGRGAAKKGGKGGKGGGGGGKKGKAGGGGAAKGGKGRKAGSAKRGRR